VEIRELLSKCRTYLPPERVALVEEAYHFARRAHEGQTRLTGEPYIDHPLNTARLLADLRLDATTLAAALLHDVLEDCGVPLEEVEARFGKEVAKLVDGVTKLSRMEVISSGDGGWRRSPGEEASHAASLRKMLVAMAEDVRVVLIKLADRLHNMRTLRAHPPERRRLIAQETLDIYAPLAHRLGISEFKWRLEDLAFRYLNPQAYRAISQLVAAKRAEREEYIAQVTRILREELEKHGIKAEVTGRAKHLYSVYKKMEKYASLGKEFGQIYDLLAVRVLVEDVPSCYSALGVVHQLWRPLPGQFDDYIANPKENLYQSLHTTVMSLGNKPLEIQIRTYRMHQMAEYGVAAHWRYKEQGTPDERFEERMTWLRQLLEWQREVAEAEEFLEGVKLDLFQDQVFVYTPKGEIKELPAGSTPLDFAYRIHTELGHRCIGAKVNGKLVPLNTRLNNGDTVEILTAKVTRGPSLDWLNPDLGYVKTAHAREKIRQWFRRQERSANIERGREMLLKELRRLSTDLDPPEVARLMHMESVEDLYAALGSGALGIHQVTARLTAQQEGREKRPPTITPPVGPASGVEVLGVGDLLTRMARCCTPVPGDEIIGFVTRTRGVTVHRRDCPNVASAGEGERLIPVNWGRVQQLHPVRLHIEAWDRVGLLRDITTLVSEERVNIASVVTQEHDDSRASVYLTLYTTGLGQLSRLCAKLEGVQGVISVARSPLAEKTEERAPAPPRG